MKVKKIIAPNWSQYELLDCGSGRKLERFGDIILDRPEINADKKPFWPKSKWQSLSNSTFHQKTSNSGTWSQSVNDWSIEYDSKFKLTMNLSLSQFKHVGVFPEQSSNWEYVYSTISKKENANALNLFAYTGAASLVARAAGANTTHIEAFSQLISKAKENMENSGLSDIRWIKEDALKFAKKEVKRQKKYDLVIMDPPTWGRGPKGEIWKIDKHLLELIKSVSKLLNNEANIVVNTYSGIPPDNLSEMLKEHMSFRTLELGNLVLKATSGSELVTGSLVRGKVR